MPCTRSRLNAHRIAQAYRLVKVARLEALAEGKVALVGECGHRLTMVAAWEEASLLKYMAGSRPISKRCTACQATGEMPVLAG